MVRVVLCVLLLLVASPPIDAACVDPKMLARSTVRIAREFSVDERKQTPDAIGVRGSGWFLSPRQMVTVAHVAEGMGLSALDWKDVEIRENEVTALISVRILRFAGTHSEKMTVLELRIPYQGAAALQIRTEPLAAGESIVSLSFAGDRPRIAGGRFVQYGAKDGFAGTALLEMYEGNDRLVIDHGASGAPVLDCHGQVVAVVTNVITQEVNLPSRVVRTSTPWQTPNVVSIPIQVLKDFSEPVRPGYLGEW